ncbi:MFS transporter [Pseudonocardia spinosispora]|uniref:MFS transporter n=1 Tax=Pseudonocardia spinosispora TaxID=103441 RepID=UPI0003F6C8BA
MEWRLGGAGIAMIGVSYGFARYGYGLFEPHIRAELGLSVGASGMVASGAYLGYVLALTAVGLLADRLGPRRLIIAAGLSAAAGTSVVALADRPVFLFAGLVVAGASSGFAWAPYSDAIDQLITPDRRMWLLAAIPSGTAFGITVAGALALSDSRWRSAWLVFSAVAVLVTGYNARLLRGTRPIRRAGRPGVGLLRRPGTPALYCTALSYGMVGAVYWTFALAAVSGAAGPVAGSVFWMVIGVSGTSAVFTGWVLARLGPRRAHALLLGGLALAAALIAVGPGWWPAIGLSAVVYGFVFMAISGLLAVWSHRTFPDRPSAGFSITVFLLGLGAVLGPALFGALADRWDLRTALLLASAIALITLVARPSGLQRDLGGRGEPEPDQCAAGDPVQPATDALGGEPAARPIDHHDDGAHPHQPDHHVDRRQQQRHR